MRVACVMMQKDEDYLLGPWLAHHGYLFGWGNLYILDNGSTNPGVIKTLATYEQRGVKVIRELGSRVDFEKKGVHVGNVIRILDSGGEFDFLVPLDCDEFLMLRTPWGYTGEREAILDYFETLQGERGTLRVPYQLANNPYADDFYTLFSFTKTFFARGTFDNLDHGFHNGVTRGGFSDREVSLVHVHMHYPPFSALVARARRKWVSASTPETAVDDPYYDGNSVHLLPYFSMKSKEYRVHHTKKVQVYIPAFRERLYFFGEPLVVPRDPDLDRQQSSSLSIEKLDIKTWDKKDIGARQRTAMFIPPGTDGDDWIKVYLNEESYLMHHPDVRAAGVLAFRHFCMYGCMESERVKSLQTTAGLLLWAI